MEYNETNEARYEEIVSSKRQPWISLLQAARKEDVHNLLPKALLRSLGTVRSVPMLWLMPTKRARRWFASRKLRKWGRSICNLVDSRLEVIGKDLIPHDRACLFVCNHMSPMDIPVLATVIPEHFAFVANQIFETIPVFHFWTKHSGSVYVKQGDGVAELAALKSMIARLANGTSLLLFPDGYIHQGEGLASFKRGGLSSALLAKAPIIPMCLYGTQIAMPPGRLYIEPGVRIRLEFSSPIETAGMTRNERKELISMVRERMLSMKAEAQVITGYPVIDPNFGSEGRVVSET